MSKPKILNVQIQPCDTRLDVVAEFEYLLEGELPDFTVSSVTHGGLEILPYLHYNTIQDIEGQIKKKEDKRNG